MKIGLIYTSYNCQEYLDDSLNPWLELKKEIGDNLLIAGVSVPFLEYKGFQEEDNVTPDFLESVCDYTVLSPKYIKEAEARDIAFQWLKTQNVDYYILADGDEIFDLNQIKNMIKFIKNNSFITWFSIAYKNYIWDKKHYIEEPFCPPRIFKSDSGIYIANKIFHDNDVAYHGKITRNIKSYKQFSSMCVPANIINPHHYTWLNNNRSKLKCAYQLAHFGENPGCSYRWDEKTESVQFNEDFFRKTGQVTPQILTEV